ncbi:MAG: IS1380 family transposase [Bacteroidetes bacterium]|nr:IS1380 family transposase [Bacteroidota bacterium]
MKLTKKYSKVELKRIKNGNTGRMGLSWIAHSMRHFGMEEMIHEVHGDKKKSNREISASQKILSGTMTMLAGGQRVEDMEVLRKDQGLLDAVGWDRMICADTILNFIAGSKNNSSNIKVNERLCIKVLKKIKAKNLTYDNDATYMDSNKDSAMYSYQKRKQFSALMGSIAETGMIHTIDYRPGNISPQTGILEQLKEACRQAKQAGKKITVFRSDSAAYKNKIMTYCDMERIKYYISVDKNEAVRKVVTNLAEYKWKIMGGKYKDNHEQQYAQAIHEVYKGYKIRILILRWKNPDPTLFDQSPYCYHVIGSNDWEIEPMVWLEKHNGRMGTIEQIHKEIKNELGCHYTPSHDFEKNRGYFFLGVLAYNMAQIMNQFYLGAQSLRWTVKTMRYRFIHVCGKIVKSGRKFTCKIINVIDDIFELYRYCHEKLQSV